MELSFRLTWQQLLWPAATAPAPARAISSVLGLTLRLFKRLPSPNPFPPCSGTSLSYGARAPAQKWQQPFLGKLCPACKGCGFGQVAVLGPRKGAAGTGSDTVPLEPGLNSCPASPGGYPGLFCRCPATCQARLCLVLLQSGLRPLSQHGAALGALARCQALRPGLLCPLGCQHLQNGVSYSCEIRQISMPWATRDAKAGGPSPPGATKASGEGQPQHQIHQLWS